MKCKPSNLFFRILFIVYIAVVAFLCFANFSKVEDAPKFFLGLPFDKVVHFCMFFPLPFLGLKSYDKYTETIPHALASVIVVCAFCCIFAGLTEIVQGMLPYRSEDVKDFGVDCLSIGIASVIVFSIDVWKILHPKRERAKSGKRR